MIIGQNNNYNINKQQTPSFGGSNELRIKAIKAATNDVSFCLKIYEDSGNRPARFAKGYMQNIKALLAKRLDQVPKFITYRTK